MFGFLKKIFGSAQDRKVRKYRKIVEEVNRWEEKFKSLSEEELKHKTQEFKERIQKGETVDDLLPEAYAVVKNACRRLCGTEVHVSGYDQRWDMVPYDVQIVGGIAMHKGCIAEMMTGEGKTLTAVMPLYLNALTGKPVHLVTVNDYLAERDCQWVGTVLRWLGLTTASLTNETALEERKNIYQADVVYGTSSEFGFDYLRDNSMALTADQQVQRGYYYAIIDEVDSILIDEARTPLIISGPAPESRQMYEELKAGVDRLVRMQRDLCNQLATEARSVLDSPNPPAKEKREEALNKLWKVSKGMPRHKIVMRYKEDPDMRTEIDNIDLYYHGDQGKSEKADALSTLYIIVDERGNEYELTDKGIQTWEQSNGKSDDFVMMDMSHEFLLIDEDDALSDDEKVQRKLAVQEEDSKSKERMHNLRQMLRAHLLMEKDVDYIVQDNKIIIIDEHTGRPQPGRRFSDGLHQAIEAKEGVSIQRETQTYATITLQNYFRMYEKLSGMSGTAVTEAGEFKEIYKLDVLDIPTNKPCIRTDANDEIYMTEREKYNAILKEIREVHENGRPILMGTESVEVSEKISRICRQNKLEHVVLNAKNHAHEAEIIAHAGRKSSITISTNMAGRGTDIKLEPGVAALGGLHVIGTTRHQSRRIDRQLRGRSARQGDPGSSKFFISFEDSLMRLFASPRLNAILQRFRPPEGEPISANILNRSIETAQKRVEQRNYTIRKHTLEYDDVMNKQRQEIYSFRGDILQNKEPLKIAEEVLDSVCLAGAEEFFVSRSEEGGWNAEGYRQWLISLFPIPIRAEEFSGDNMEVEEIAQIASDKVVEAFREKAAREMKKFENIPYRPAYANDTPVETAVRNLMIRELDHLWQAHLLTMDHLRADVSLRSVGQRDPLTEFKHEAFSLFQRLSVDLRRTIGQNLFKFEIVPFDANQLQQIMRHIKLERDRSLVSEMDQAPPPEVSTNRDPDVRVQRPPEEKREPIHVDARPGRNDPCSCGSGKKYKKCCGLKEEFLEAEVAE